MRLKKKGILKEFENAFFYLWRDEKKIISKNEIESKISPKKNIFLRLESITLFWMATSGIFWFAEFGLRTIQSFGFSTLTNSMAFKNLLLFTQAFFFSYTFSKSISFLKDFSNRLGAKKEEEKYLQLMQKKYANIYKKLTFRKISYALLTLGNEKDLSFVVDELLKKDVIAKKTLIKGIYVKKEKELHYICKDEDGIILKKHEQENIFLELQKKTGITFPAEEDAIKVINHTQAFKISDTLDLGPQNTKWFASIGWFFLYGITAMVILGFFFIRPLLMVTFPMAGLALEIALKCADVSPILLESFFLIMDANDEKKINTHEKNTNKKIWIDRCVYFLKITATIVLIFMYFFPGTQAPSLGIIIGISALSIVYDYVFVPIYNRFFIGPHSPPLKAEKFFEKLCVFVYDMVISLIPHKKPMVHDSFSHTSDPASVSDLQFSKNSSKSTPLFEAQRAGAPEKIEPIPTHTSPSHASSATEIPVDLSQNPPKDDETKKGRKFPETR